MNLIEGLIQILTEAPMSDEDRSDSEILRNIFDKRRRRSNARLTPDEQAVLNKYGVYMDDDSLIIPDSQNSKYNWVKSSSFSKDWIDNPEVNIADKIRKTPQRDYAREVKYTGNRFSYQDAADAGLGTEHERRNWHDTEFSFPEKERIKNSREDKYRSAYNAMKTNLRDRKFYDSELANYDAEKERITKAYQDQLKELEKDNEYDLKHRDEANQRIDDIKNRFRR